MRSKDHQTILTMYSLSKIHLELNIFGHLCNLQTDARDYDDVFHEWKEKVIQNMMTFDKKEAFLYHLNFHSSYIDPAEAAKQGKIFFFYIVWNIFETEQCLGLAPPFLANINQAVSPDQHQTASKRQRSSPTGSSPTYSVSPRDATGSDWSRAGQTGNCTQSPRCTCQECGTARQNKKRKQVEDIDPETLKKIQALEWEKKHG